LSSLPLQLLFLVVIPKGDLLLPLPLLFLSSSEEPVLSEADPNTVSS